MEQIFARLDEIFQPARVAERITGFLPDLAVAFLSFLVFYIVWRIARRAIEPVIRHAGVDDTARAFLQTILKCAILAIGTVTALGQLGVDTASLLTSLGVAGLTIGFAAKDALSNVISGIFIFWDRPFVIGDLVEVDGRYGRVEDITLRSTRLVTSDGKMLAIPNTTIVNTTVASSRTFPTCESTFP